MSWQVCLMIRQIARDRLCTHSVAWPNWAAWSRLATPIGAWTGRKSQAKTLHEHVSTHAIALGPSKALLARQ